MLGDRIAHYEVLGELGAGGMGVVYRARDLRLDREVAIKALPEEFTQQADRVVRFEREAKMLASLNHPRIAAIHGMERSEGKSFLILELVEGDTLADLISRGPVPARKAMELARQITEALEAAHACGIVHRDLKPANVKATPEGEVKVLDFGLAKTAEPKALDVDLSQSPTLMAEMTGPGVLTGTAAYMSPEQVRGQPVDKRADIWAFGCLLYEMLSGRRAFGGKTVPDILAAVVRGEPDWQALPATTPWQIRRLLRRCLQQEPAKRLHDIADARLEIVEALAGPGEELAGGGPSGTARRRSWIAPVAAAALTGLVIGGAVGWTLHTRPPPAPRVTRFSLQLGPGSRLGGIYSPAIAIDPAGERIAFSRTTAEGTQIYLRQLDGLEALAVPGTEGASQPFFSPDGSELGFLAAGQMRKVPVEGGDPVTLCRAAGLRGASWAADGTIVYVPGMYAGIWRIPASGGTPTQILDAGARAEDAIYVWPQVLPDGAILFTTYGQGDYQYKAAVRPAGGGPRQIVLENASYARYLPTGHLLFLREEKMWIAPFDLSRPRIVGTPVQMLEGVLWRGLGLAQIDVSDAGTLVYAPGAGADQPLLLADRQGEVTVLPAPPRHYVAPAWSPDGRRIAVEIPGANSDLWLYELDRGTLTRLTYALGTDEAPTWSPDGRQIGFSSYGRGKALSVSSGGGGDERPLFLVDNHYGRLSDWSADGSRVFYEEHNAETGMDIWEAEVGGEPRLLLQTEFNEDSPRLSPDGRWLAYRSDESGRSEIYVRRYPLTGAKWQVSTDGGFHPRWPETAAELFFRSGGKLMSAAIQSGEEFEASRPRMLFEAPFGSSYDVSPDGTRFVFAGQAPQGPAEVHVVLNWFDEVRKALGSV